VNTHIIKGSTGESRIILGESLTQLEKYIAGRKYVIITDEQVYRLYGEVFLDHDVIVIGTGERIKILDTVEMIYRKFLDFELNRSSVVVAIGGGIVCDIAGFAASTFLRGIAFGFVPTTLLAQVDASVGGKNGVNFRGYKNIIGVFSQPEFVLIDFSLLKTLKKQQLRCGFAEAIKHGAIADSHLFAFMEEHADDIKNLEFKSLERIVNDSIVIKSSIVNKDEREKGERRKLNFGHTFGHAIEKTLGLPHGEAVSIGMVVAAMLSKTLGSITDSEVKRLMKLLDVFDLPITIDVKKTRLKNAIRKDKKRYGDSIKVILLEEIGRSSIKDVRLQELEAVIDDLYLSCGYFV
jgi:3-dehydroquinate synthase